MRFKDKVAFITGGGRGIGETYARALSAEGAAVVLAEIDMPAAEGVAASIADRGGRALAVACDVADESSVDTAVARAVEHFGGIDILINNAGRGYDAPVELIDIKPFRYIYDLNIIGPIVAMQQVIPIMKKQGGGAIINISSGTALMDLPGMSPYSSSKKALAGISLAARQELEGAGIVVSVAYPYITLTEFEKNTIRAVPVPGKEIEPTGPFPSDSAEFVAERIVEGILTGEAEIFSHEWQKARRTQGE